MWAILESYIVKWRKYHFITPSLHHEPIHHYSLRSKKKKNSILGYLDSLSYDRSRRIISYDMSHSILTWVFFF